MKSCLRTEINAESKYIVLTNDTQLIFRIPVPQAFTLDALYSPESDGLRVTIENDIGESLKKGLISTKYVKRFCEDFELANYNNVIEIAVGN